MQALYRSSSPPPAVQELVESISFGKKFTHESIIGAELWNDNKYASVTSGNSVITINIAEQKKLLNEKSLHSDVISDLSIISQDGDCATKVTVSFDRCVKLSKPNTVLRETKLPNWLNSCEVNGENIWVGDLNGAISVLSIPNLSVVHTISDAHPTTKRTAAINSISFGRDGMAASVGADGSIKFWDSKTFSEIFAIENAHGGEKMNDILFHANQRAIVSSGRDSTVRLWDSRMLSTKPVKVMRDSSHVNSIFRMNLAWDSEDSVATGSENGKVIIYSLLSGAKESEIQISSSPVHSILSTFTNGRGPLSTTLVCHSVKSLMTHILRRTIPYESKKKVSEAPSEPLTSDFAFAGEEDNLINLLQTRGLSLSSVDALYNFFNSSAQSGSAVPMAEWIRSLPVARREE